MSRFSCASGALKAFSLCLTASLVIFLAGPRTALAAGSASVGQTYTTPQCLMVWEGAPLMADTTSPDDCILGTTGGPF